MVLVYGQDECKGLVYIVALTPVHAGVGRAEGAHVDLPVQRDEFEMPVIWASSIKGSLRSKIVNSVLRGREPQKLDACKQDQFRDVEDCKKFLICLGPAPASDEVSEYASAVTFLDARLFLIPARSLRGVWLYVTTPHMLRIYNNYKEAIDGSRVEELDEVANKAAERALVSSSNYLIDGKLVVNEQIIGAEVDGRLPEILKEALKEVASQLSKFRSSLDVAVVPDEYGWDVIRRSLIVQYRVRLRRDTKTVESGGLWSEEYVPQFTTFVSAVICRRPRRIDSSVGSAADCLNFLKEKVGGVVELGGKETIGKGLVRVFWP